MNNCNALHEEAKDAHARSTVLDGSDSRPDYKGRCWIISPGFVNLWTLIQRVIPKQHEPSEGMAENTKVYTIAEIVRRRSSQYSEDDHDRLICVRLGRCY